jgi:4-amino-4-deoxy-L-arabinose transferase-like glycosyltransferase
VAWLLAASLRLLGHHALAARLPAVLLQAGTTLLAAALAGARGGPRAAWTAALLLQAAPVFSLGAVLITPDAPLAFGWAGALWAFDRATSKGGGWFLAGGLFLGIALLSKISAGALGIALLTALLATPRDRRALATPWPWLGGALALAMASPFLVWNAARGWPSFAFQLQHGLGGREFSFARLAGSVGAQAAYVSPWLMALAAIAAWQALRTPADAGDRALAFAALPVAAFFTLAAAMTPGSLPHWPAPAWLSATILLAVGRVRVPRAAVAMGVAMTATVVLAVVADAHLPLPGDPIDELRGWREAAAAARTAAGDARLAANHWITMGLVGWYADEDVAYVGDRPCAATLYAGDPTRAGRPLLVVIAGHMGPAAADLEGHMGPLEPAGTFVAVQGRRPVRGYRFYRWTGR